MAQLADNTFRKKDIGGDLQRFGSMLESNRKRRLTELMGKRESAIRDAILSGQDPAQALQAIQQQGPSSMLGKIGQFLQGGRIDPSQVPLGGIESALLEAKMKSQYKQPSRLDQFSDDIKRAKSGEIGWDDLKVIYEAQPAKTKLIDILKNRYTKVERSPQFTKGTGSPFSHIKSKFSPNQAEMNEKTLMVAEQINSEELLQELLSRRKEAEGEGIDVRAILEYFGRGK